MAISLQAVFDLDDTEIIKEPSTDVFNPEAELELGHMGRRAFDQLSRVLVAKTAAEALVNAAVGNALTIQDFLVGTFHRCLAVRSDSAAVAA